MRVGEFGGLRRDTQPQFGVDHSGGGPVLPAAGEVGSPDFSQALSLSHRPKQKYVYMSRK